MKVLLAPLLVRGGGTGHLRRCLDAAGRLAGRAAFVTGIDGDEPLADSLGAWPRVAAGATAGGPALVVADRRRTSASAYRRLRALGPVVGIDEGGPARRWMTCLIDTLPFGGRGANLQGLDLLDLPERRRPAGNGPPRRVLVSFGGEDPAGLSLPVLRDLVRGGLFAPGQIAVVQGPRFEPVDWPAGISVLVDPPRLRDLLHEYDLVLTSFGLTCYEALAAGVPVVLVSPTRYHRRLARGQRLPEAGLRRLRTGALRRLLADGSRLQRPVEDVQSRRGAGAGLAETIATLRDPGAGCPACGAPGAGRRPDAAVARFADRTYFRCASCRLLYMARFAGAETGYGHDYFFEGYARQYGRTYLEDFDSILDASRARVGVIESLIGPLAGLRVLDVGCAYGPFLAAAAERGASAAGVEVEAEAAAHVRDKLGLECWEGPFQDYQGAPASRDVVTMWYVIEHFADLASVLKRVNALLAPGGVFALSTPNAAGISGLRPSRRGQALFYTPDHYTIWDPRHARRVLARFGLRLESVHVTGHHPRRFPLAGNVRAGSAAFGLLRAASEALRLGDTFEAYAVKVRDLDA
jgi:2-polyprenyl-3-methyl-5-hydroxy-6-metoxy-1,4-benzoquinol methylase